MDLEKKRVLITGSSGFIGSYLLKELEKEKSEIVKVDRTYGKDITKWECLKNIRNIDLIFHLAAVTDVPFSWGNPRLTYEINVCGTNNILELARINNVENLVFISTYVYGTPAYLPVDENHPTNPNNPYSESKLVAEKLVHSYSNNYGINCLVLRPFNIYGSGQRENFLIPSILKQLKTGKVILKDPTPKRDFIYIDDFIQAMMDSVQINFKFEILNIGSGKSYSVEEVARKIIGHYPEDIKLTFTGETRTNEIYDCFADISKAKKLLGWDPKIELSDGLKRVVEIFKEKSR